MNPHHRPSVTPDIAVPLTLLVILFVFAGIAHCATASATETSGLGVLTEQYNLSTTVTVRMTVEKSLGVMTACLYRDVSGVLSTAPQRSMVQGHLRCRTIHLPRLQCDRQSLKFCAAHEPSEPARAHRVV